MSPGQFDLLTGATPAFKLFSTVHILTLLCIAVLAALAVMAGRRLPVRWRKVVAVVLAVLYGGAELYWMIKNMGTCDRVRDCLPLHLCDVSVIMTVIALATHWRFPFEFAYFFGLAGTLQALVTPDLPFGFPSESFFQFFVGHGGIIIAVAYLISAFALRPYWRSLLRMIATGYVYLIIVGLLDWRTGTNYGYLRAKPTHASLLDHMGRWPWYLLGLQVIAVFNLLLLYLPYWLIDLRRKRIVPVTE
jgi:hypothetical integral membrane protein (TIGR02206 family)